MTRRFPLAPLLFLALWSLFFALPPLRPYARSDWKRVGSPPDPDKPPQLRAGQGRDALVAMASSYGNRGESFIQLEKRFPQDVTLYAGQLTQSASKLQIYTVRQNRSASKRGPNASAKTALPSRPSPAFLAMWFAACARGEKLEQSNTFWDWMRIMGLLAARRDQEVWPVLHAARSKTAYDDHTNDYTAARLREERRQFGVLSPLDELNEKVTDTFNFRIELETAASLLTDDAWRLRLQNTQQSRTTALEGMRDFVLLCGTMRRKQKTFIGAIIGSTMEKEALWGGSFPSGSPTSFIPRVGARWVTYVNNPYSLAHNAQLNGRSDIVAQLKTEWLDRVRYQAKMKIVSSSLLVGEEGINGRDFTLASLGDWWRPRLLTGIPLALGLAALASLLLRWIPALRREREISLSRASWVLGGAIGLWSTVMLSASLIWNVGKTWQATHTPFSNLGFALLFFGTLGRNTSLGAPRAWELAFPSAMLCLGALWIAAGWDRQQRGEPSLTARLRRLTEAPDDGFARFDASPLLALISRFAALCLGTLGVLAYLIVPALNSDASYLWDYAGLALLLVTFIAGVPTTWRIQSARGRVFALLLARRFAWSFLLSLSLCWAALTLATAPAHRRFEAQIDRTLRVGEFQLARKRLGF